MIRRYPRPEIFCIYHKLAVATFGALVEGELETKTFAGVETMHREDARVLLSKLPWNQERVNQGRHLIIPIQGAYDLLLLVTPGTHDCLKREATHGTTGSTVG